MSLVELFRNYDTGNSGNSTDLKAVTAESRANISGNSSNSGNSENRIYTEKVKNNIQEQIEERVAIMEYDGGLSRKDVEREAAAAIRVYCYRVKEKPGSELVAIMPNTKLDEAYECLRLKFGGSAIDCL